MNEMTHGAASSCVVDLLERKAGLTEGAKPETAVASKTKIQVKKDCFIAVILDVVNDKQHEAKVNNVRVRQSDAVCGVRPFQTTGRFQFVYTGRSA